MITIAFIGLGNMGGGMAANLAKAASVRAFDLSSAALDKAKANGCAICSSAIEAVRGADAVITMLPAGPQVRALYDEAILPHASTQALTIDCSTIDVETARAVATDAKAKGLRPADAPVSGGTAAA